MKSTVTKVSIESSEKEDRKQKGSYEYKNQTQTTQRSQHRQKDK